MNPDRTYDGNGATAVAPDLERLTLLVEASARLLGSLELDEVVAEVLGLAKDALKADAYAVWLHDRKTGRWDVRAAAGLSDDYQRAATDAIRGQPGEVALDEPLVVEDIEAAPWMVPAHLAAHRAEGNRAMLVAGLTVDEQTVGTVAFYFREPRAFSEMEVRAATTLANLAAAAIRTAELYANERRTSEDRRFLVEASAVLSSSLEYETTLANVARLAVPHFADWCTVDVVQPDGTIGRLAVAHVDPAKVRWANELAERYPPDPDAPYGVPNVVRTGTAELLSEIPDDLLVEATKETPELLEILRELGLRSSLCVPLVLRRGVAGAITFVAAESGRIYSEADLELASDLARHASLAIENALLYRDVDAERERVARVGERERFLAEASELLAESLEYETTLNAVAKLVVPKLAGQCIVDLVREDGTTTAVAVAHVEPEKEALLREVRESYPPVAEGHPVRRVLETGRPVLLPELDDDVVTAMAQDERHVELIRALGNRSGIVAPLSARGRTLGAITVGTVDPQPPFDDEDVRLIAELARRAAFAVDNALLYRAAEERAQAARALSFVADGVFLADEDGTVQLWNRMAERITGLAAAEVVGEPLAALLPAWRDVAPRVPVVEAQSAAVRPETIPLETRTGERWLSIIGVASPHGTVYAFRDVTDERQVERLKSEFVATVSHELRTPLAAVYGGAQTLLREEGALPEREKRMLVEVIADESERLARIVDEVLLASQLDSGGLRLVREDVDPAGVAEAVVSAARSRAPENLELRLDVATDPERALGDPDKVRQVLANLVDNAIKYSPGGGSVTVAVECPDGRVRFSVRDEGLGIPAGEKQRIFEKFHRLDPNMTRGVGGTGLGLYISRELVQRMDGRIWVESDEGRGSTFTFELPQAD